MRKQHLNVGSNPITRVWCILSLTLEKLFMVWLLIMLRWKNMSMSLSNSFRLLTRHWLAPWWWRCVPWNLMRLKECVSKLWKWGILLPNLSCWRLRCLTHFSLTLSLTHSYLNMDISKFSITSIRRNGQSMNVCKKKKNNKDKK